MSDFNSDPVHYMYSYDNFARNKFATAFIEKKKTWRCFILFTMMQDSGLIFLYRRNITAKLQKHILNIKILFQVFFIKHKDD